MGMTLVNLAPGVWTSAEIVRLPAIRFPVRVGVFRLGDGSLMLVSPTPRIGELAAEISALGPVSAIVEPNALHHLGLAAARAAFPAARSFGPPGLAGKISGQPLPEPLVDGPGVPWSGAVDLVAVEGMPHTEETVLFHRSSRTLWVTDLAFNVRTSDHLPTRALHAAKRSVRTLRALADRPHHGEGPRGAPQDGRSAAGTRPGAAAPRAWRSGGGGCDPGARRCVRAPARVLASPGIVVWWMWFAAGVGLLVFELVTPGGFFAFFFGAAAILVGLLTAIHLAGPEWLQWLLFSIFSVAGVVLLRKPVMQRLGVGAPALPSEEMRGEWALVTEEVRPGDVGKVELRGTSWSARANRTVRVGERVPVERIEGLTVWLGGTDGRGGWTPGGGST
jgi:membrane protein implicated in regulation of membrane protease activity